MYGISRGGTSSTLPFGFRKLGTFAIPCRQLAKHRGKMRNTIHCAVSYPFWESFCFLINLALPTLRSPGLKKILANNQSLVFPVLPSQDKIKTTSG